MVQCKLQSLALTRGPGREGARRAGMAPPARAPRPGVGRLGSAAPSAGPVGRQAAGESRLTLLPVPSLRPFLWTRRQGAPLAPP